MNDSTLSLFVPFHTCTLCGKSYPRTPEFFYTQRKCDGRPKGDGMRPRCKDCNDSAKVRSARVSQECRVGKRAAYLPKDAPSSECTLCARLLPRTEEFYYRGKRGHFRRQCKLCCNAISRKNSAQPASKQRHHDRMREKVFSITGEEFAVMVNAQNGVCAICGKPETRKTRTGKETRKLAVDHDHKTGQVRGLLCGSCNSGIGYLADSPDLFRAAVEYLEKHAAIYNKIHEGKTPPTLQEFRFPNGILEPTGDMA